MFARRECNDAFRQLLAAQVEQAEGWLRGGLPLAAQMPPGLRLPVALFVQRRIGYAGGHPPAELRRVDPPADGFATREAAIADRLLVETAFRQRDELTLMPRSMPRKPTA